MRTTIQKIETYIFRIHTDNCEHATNAYSETPKALTSHRDTYSAIYQYYHKE